MTPRPAPRPLLALATLGLLMVGCSSNSAGYLARFNAPADIVQFRGITKKNAGLHDYFAVASARGGDLTFIDAWDDRAVPSPGAVYSISVTTDPRPVMLAAAPLGDAASGGSDLLVAVSAGSLDLQVIETWTVANRVVPSASVALAAVVGEGDALSIAAFTMPPAGDGAPRARVLVAMSGGRVAVVDFTRDASTGGVTPGAPLVKSIGVDAVGIAVDPVTLKAYFATNDPLPASGTTPMFGVASVDAGGDPALPWPVGSLDARGPTKALAVARVNERIVDANNINSVDTFDTVARFRIYAVLDPSGCGPDRAINCGVAMLDENGILPDPGGELTHRAPLPVPAVPARIAVMLPPTSGNTRVAGDVLNPTLTLMLAQPSARYTTALAAVTSSDGAVYLYDLSRYSPVNAGSALLIGFGVTTTGSFQSIDAADPTSPNYGKPMYLGLWNDFPTASATGGGVNISPSYLPYSIQVTPGYTPSDTFSITWQGELPGFLARRGVIGRAVTGETYVAIQSPVATGSQAGWGATADVTDPGLGIHAGDIVVLTPDDASLCPTNDPARPSPEVLVAPGTPVLPADPARFPGGAVQLAAGSCFEQQLAPGQVATATVTIRASGLVLTSTQLGYLGRPTFDQPFVLSHTDESQLTGEALSVDRKLRRRFYPTEASCPQVGCYPNFPLVRDPIAPGAFLGFKVGIARIDVPGVTQDPTNPANLALLPRGSRIIATTITGPPLVSFRPVTQGVLPGGVVTYDPTAVPVPGHENDGVHFYAAYRDDQVLDIVPTVTGGFLKIIR